jgi:hypothetical protein
MALNRNTKWVIGIVAAFVIPAGGAIAGLAVGNYRIGQTEQNVAELKANNNYAHELITNGYVAGQKEIMAAITDIKIDLATVKTDIRNMRRNHNQP